MWTVLSGELYDSTVTLSLSGQVIGLWVQHWQRKLLFNGGEGRITYRWSIVVISAMTLSICQSRFSAERFAASRCDIRHLYFNCGG